MFVIIIACLSKAAVGEVFPLFACSYIATGPLKMANFHCTCVVPCLVNKLHSICVTVITMHMHINNYFIILV